MDVPCVYWEELQQKLHEWEEEERKFIEEERQIVYEPNNAGSEQQTEDSEAVNINKYEKAFLLIQAPTESEVSTKSYKAAEKLEYADNRRTSQYEHFCLLHPDLKNVDPKVTEQDFVTVSSYNEMKSAMTGFMESYGHKAKAASVCFNGYNDNVGEGNGNDVNPHCKIKKEFLLIQTDSCRTY